MGKHNRATSPSRQTRETIQSRRSMFRFPMCVLHHVSHATSKTTRSAHLATKTRYTSTSTWVSVFQCALKAQPRLRKLAWCVRAIAKHARAQIIPALSATRTSSFTKAHAFLHAHREPFFRGRLHVMTLKPLRCFNSPRTSKRPNLINAVCFLSRLPQ